MLETVKSPLGTAHIMNDLPFEVAAKTGSAQIEGNKYENAFFVGFAPKDNPQIAILILVEKAREGSLNAVPIAKDALNWYYENRMKNR
jgi:cell division protein FtsI/penicillin-binding protein 2